MNNIVAFIPARGGSKGIPFKNIKLLGGKPLIAYSIESAQKCGLRVVVSTDSEEIANIAKEYGAEVLFVSPFEAKLKGIHQNKSSMYDVLKSEIPKTKADFVLLLQCTSPFRKSIHIKTAISYLMENLDQYDSLVFVERVPEKYSPYAMIVENKMLFRKLIGLKEKWFNRKKFIGPSLSGYPISQRMTRRQDMPTCWLPTGEIYLFRSDNLKSGSIYGNRVMLLENEPSININNLEDFEKAELCLKQIKKYV